MPLGNEVFEPTKGGFLAGLKTRHDFRGENHVLSPGRPRKEIMPCLTAGRAREKEIMSCLRFQPFEFSESGNDYS